MIIKRRIRSLRTLRLVAGKNSTVVLAIENPARFESELKKMGFSWPLLIGESILPAGHFGPAANRNANGWDEVHKDQPMETAYRQVIWRWRMKRGWDYEEASKLVNVPYQRYPRTEHPPYGMEMRVSPLTNGELIATLGPLTLREEDEAKTLTAINLLVEIFQECTVLTKDLQRIITAPIKHLNWRVLPPGAQPWPALKTEVDQLLAKTPEKVKEVIENRLEIINSFKPDFVAVGTHGFSGYLVFGFRDRIHLLESIYFGNATYGLGSDWKRLSTLSKGELLANSLHAFRIVHSASWPRDIAAEMRRQGVG